MTYRIYLYRCHKPYLELVWPTFTADMTYVYSWHELHRPTSTDVMDHIWSWYYIYLQKPRPTSTDVMDHICSWYDLYLQKLRHTSTDVMDHIWSWHDLHLQKLRPTSTDAMDHIWSSYYLYLQKLRPTSTEASDTTIQHEVTVEWFFFVTFVLVITYISLLPGTHITTVATVFHHVDASFTPQLRVRTLTRILTLAIYL